MPYTINPRELRLLRESGMSWDSAKKITRMVKKIFVNSEVIAVSKIEPDALEEGSKVVPINKPNEDTVYLTVGKRDE